MRAAWRVFVLASWLVLPAVAGAGTISLCTGTTGTSPCPLPGSLVAGGDSVVVLAGNTAAYHLAGPGGYYADSGAVVIRPGGIFALTGWAWVRALGVGVLDNSGSVASDASVQIEDDAPFFNRAGATFSNTSETMVYDDGVLHNAGTIDNSGYLYTLIDSRNDPSGDPDNPTVDNSGLFTNHAGADVAADGEFYNSGVFSNQVGASFDNTGLLSNTGLFVNDGAITNARYDPTGARILNAGDFRISGSGSLDRGSVTIPAGSYWQSAGRTTANGLVREALVYVMGGQLCGTGSLQGVIRVGDGVALPAELSPGDSTAATATLAVVGSLALGADSRVVLDIAPSPSYDRVTSSGRDTLGGELALRVTPGNAPAPDDTLTVFTASTVVGTFSAVTVNGVPATGSVIVLYEPARVRVVLPASAAVDPVRSGEAGGVRFTAMGVAPRPAFALQLPRPGRVRVVLLDVTGRLVAVVHDGALGAGSHRLSAGSGPAASGVYFARATVADAAGIHVLDARAIAIR